MKFRIQFDKIGRPVRFIVTGLLLYLIWIILYEGVIKPRHWIDPWLTNIVSEHSVAMLNVLGFETGQIMTGTGNLIFNDHSNLLIIAYICDGLILYIIFAIFLIAFPGPVRHKLWFIPAGFILIYIINLIRVVALVIIQIKAHQYLAFNHKYTFTILVYGFIFLLWFIWVRYFAPAKKVST